MISLICPNPKCLHPNVVAVKEEDITVSNSFTCDKCDQPYGVISLFGTNKTFAKKARPVFATDSGEDDCQCLICLMRRGEAVGNPDETHPIGISVMLDLLRATREVIADLHVDEEQPPEQPAAELFADDLFKTHGDVMLELFPEGIVLTTAEEINRYTLVSAIAGNLSRYAKAFLEGGDEHALREIKTFAAMLQDLDLEVHIDG